MTRQTLNTECQNMELQLIDMMEANGVHIISAYREYIGSRLTRYAGLRNNGNKEDGYWVLKAAIDNSKSYSKDAPRWY